MASCTKCGVRNEYQDEPYTCRDCRRPEALAKVEATIEAGMLHGPVVSLAELDAEIVRVADQVVSRYDPAYGNSPLADLLKRRAELLANPEDIHAADLAVEGVGSMWKIAKAAIEKLPDRIQGKFWTRLHRSIAE